MKRFEDYWKEKLGKSNTMNFAVEAMLNAHAKEIEKLKEKQEKTTEMLWGGDEQKAGYRTNKPH